jgi:hypothetical protein
MQWWDLRGNLPRRRHDNHANLHEKGNEVQRAVITQPIVLAVGHASSASVLTMPLTYNPGRLGQYGRWSEAIGMDLPELLEIENE